MMSSGGYTSGVVNILYWNSNIKEIQLKFLLMVLVFGYYIIFVHDNLLKMWL